MTIKQGDLVMVVKPVPCCGNANGIGSVVTVSAIARHVGKCGFCGAISDRAVASFEGYEGNASVERLKKIDPPAEGDSLPTRADIEVPA